MCRQGMEVRNTSIRIRIHRFTLARIRIRLFTLIRIWILLFIKVTGICDHRFTDHPGFHFEPSRTLCERRLPSKASL